MKPFIPTFRIVREGVINGIPTEYSEEEWLEAAESNIKIKDIKRINKRVKNHDDNLFTWVPSRAIIVTFTGQTLPSFFKIKSEVGTLYCETKTIFQML